MRRHSDEATIPSDKAAQNPETRTWRRRQQPLRSTFVAVAAAADDESGSPPDCASVSDGADSSRRSSVASSSNASSEDEAGSAPSTSSPFFGAPALRPIPPPPSPPPRSRPSPLTLPSVPLSPPAALPRVPPPLPREAEQRRRWPPAQTVPKAPLALDRYSPTDDGGDVTRRSSAPTMVMEGLPLRSFQAQVNLHLAEEELASTFAAAAQPADGREWGEEGDSGTMAGLLGKNYDTSSLSAQRPEPPPRRLSFLGRIATRARSWARIDAEAAVAAAGVTEQQQQRGRRRGRDGTGRRILTPPPSRPGEVIQSVARPATFITAADGRKEQQAVDKAASRSQQPHMRPQIRRVVPRPANSAPKPRQLFPPSPTPHHASSDSDRMDGLATSKYVRAASCYEEGDFESANQLFREVIQIRGATAVTNSAPANHDDVEHPQVVRARGYLAQIAEATAARPTSVSASASAPVPVPDPVEEGSRRLLLRPHPPPLSTHRGPAPQAAPPLMTQPPQLATEVPALGATFSLRSFEREFLVVTSGDTIPTSSLSSPSRRMQPPQPQVRQQQEQQQQDSKSSLLTGVSVESLEREGAVDADGGDGEDEDERLLFGSTNWDAVLTDSRRTASWRGRGSGSGSGSGKSSWSEKAGRLPPQQPMRGRRPQQPARAWEGSDPLSRVGGPVLRRQSDYFSSVSSHTEFVADDHNCEGEREECTSPALSFLTDGSGTGATTATVAPDRPGRAGESHSSPTQMSSLSSPNMTYSNSSRFASSAATNKGGQASLETSLMELSPSHSRRRSLQGRLPPLVPSSSSTVSDSNLASNSSTFGPRGVAFLEDEDDAPPHAARRSASMGNSTKVFSRGRSRSSSVGDCSSAAGPSATLTIGMELRALERIEGSLRALMSRRQVDAGPPLSSRARDGSSTFLPSSSGSSLPDIFTDSNGTSSVTFSTSLPSIRGRQRGLQATVEEEEDAMGSLSQRGDKRWAEVSRFSIPSVVSVSSSSGRAAVDGTDGVGTYIYHDAVEGGGGGDGGVVPPEPSKTLRESRLSLSTVQVDYEVELNDAVDRSSAAGAESVEFSLETMSIIPAGYSYSQCSADEDDDECSSVDIEEELVSLVGIYSTSGEGDEGSGFEPIGRAQRPEQIIFRHFSTAASSVVSSVMDSISGRTWGTGETLFSYSAGAESGSLSRFESSLGTDCAATEERRRQHPSLERITESPPQASSPVNGLLKAGSSDPTDEICCPNSPSLAASYPTDEASGLGCPSLPSHTGRETTSAAAPAPAPESPPVNHFDEGIRLLSEGYPSEAKPLLIFALKDRIDSAGGVGHPLVFSVLEHLGNACTQMGQPEEAHVFLCLALRSLKMFSAPVMSRSPSSAGNRPTEQDSQYRAAKARVYVSLGDLYFKSSNFTRALQFYEKSLALRTNISGCRSDADCVESTKKAVNVHELLAFLALQRRDYESHLFHSREICWLSKNLPKDADRITAFDHINLSLSQEEKLIASVVSRLGSLHSKKDSTKPFSYRREITHLLTPKGSSVTPDNILRILDGVALLHQSKREVECAICVHREKLALLARLEKHDAVADTLCQVGLICVMSGRHFDAVDYLSSALNLKREKHGNDNEDVKLLERVLGSSYLAVGNYSMALKHFQVYVETCSNQRAVDIFLTMGIMNSKVEYMSEALTCFSEALRAELGNPQGDKRYSLIKNMTTMFLTPKKFPKATDIYERAMDFADMKAVLINYGLAQLQQRRNPHAKSCLRDLFLHMEAWALRNTGPLGVTKCMGNMLFRRCRYQEAILYYEKAVQMLRGQESMGNLRAQDELDLLTNLATAYFKTGSQEKSMSLSDKALKELQRSHDQNDSKDLGEAYTLTFGMEPSRAGQLAEQLSSHMTVPPFGFTQNINLEGIDMNWHYQAVTLCSDGKYDEAISIFRGILGDMIADESGTELKYVQLHMDISNAYLLKGDFEESKKSIDSAAQLINDGKVPSGHPVIKQVQRLHKLHWPVA